MFENAINGKCSGGKFRVFCVWQYNCKSFMLVTSSENEFVKGSKNSAPSYN